jgi:hypothetical protein
LLRANQYLEKVVAGGVVFNPSGTWKNRALSPAVAEAFQALWMSAANQQAGLRDERELR